MLLGLAFLGVFLAWQSSGAKPHRENGKTRHRRARPGDPWGFAEHALCKVHSAIQHGPPGQARWRPGARAMRTLTSRAGAAATAKSSGDTSPASAPRA